MIEITSAKGSCGTIVTNLLMELSIPFVVNYVDLTVHHNDKGNSIFGVVPVLKHGTFLLTQTTAICLYVCENFDLTGKMLSLNADLRSKQIECLIALATDVQPVIRLLFKSNIESNLDFESLITEAVVYIKTKLENSSGPWLFGENHTLNDIYGFELMRWVSNTKYSSCLAPIKTWMNKCMTLDSVAKSIKLEHLNIWQQHIS